MRFEVDADLYEGPLSLLVELTRFNLIDIFIVKLVELTQQYRELVKGAHADLNGLAEPLPLLGSLVAIKARALLPQPPPVEEEEGPVSLEELERRLKEYERFKTVAQLLAEFHALQHQRFTRPPQDVEALGAREQPLAEVDWRGLPTPYQPLEVGLRDLMHAFAKVLEKSAEPVYEVTAEPWTVEQKGQELRLLLTVHRQVRFLELFRPQQNRLELVVTFLALLELIRQRLVRAVQERLFEDIIIQTVEPL